MGIKRIIRKRLVEKLPGKVQLMVERCYISHFVKNYMEDEIHIIKRFCDPGKNALDIGANQGTLTMFLSKYASHVYCYEPVPWLALLLKEKYKKCNVSIEECALGARDEELFLNIPTIGTKKMETRSSFATDFHESTILGQRVSKVEKVKVRVRKLDDIGIDNIGFIKIDVEGFEQQVLEGGKNIIKSNMPHILIEIEQRYHSDKNIYDIFSDITELGYKGYFANERCLRDIREFNVETMQRSSDEKGELYVNNFLFTTMPINDRTV